MITTLTYKEVKVRKEHQCITCFRKFSIGSKMWYWAGIHEGGFDTCYTCSTCHEIIRIQGEGEYVAGEIYEQLDKGQTPEDLLKQLQTKSLTSANEREN